MKKDLYISALIILGACVVGVLIIYSRSDPQRFLVNKASEQIKIDSKDWPLYKNERLGIALKHPTHINGSEMVFFEAGNILFITTASSSLYKHRGEFLSNNDDSIFKRVDEINEKYPTESFYGSWVIWTHEVNVDNDLESVIQKWFGDRRGFGDGCELGEKMPSSQVGVYDVGVATVRGDQNDANSSCWINWRVGFKYSPQHHRAAIWDIGQEAQFPVCAEIYNCEADSLMAKSFAFIPKKP